MAFLIESLKKLEPDQTEQQTKLLLELVAIQRGISNGTSVADVPHTPSSNNFRPSAHDISINILWVASLILTLSLAVLMTLLKQWIRNYSLNLPTEPDRQARLKHFRFTGFHDWNVPALMEYAPLLLHLSLFLFLIGLFLYVFKLNISLLVVAGILIGVTLTAYLLAGCLPAFYTIIWRCIQMRRVLAALIPKEGVPRAELPSTHEKAAGSPMEKLIHLESREVQHQQEKTRHRHRAVALQFSRSKIRRPGSPVLCSAPAKSGIFTRREAEQ